MDETGDVGVADDDQAVRRNRGGLGEGPVNVEAEQAVGAADDLEGPESAGAGIGADDGQTIAGDGSGIGVSRLGVRMDVHRGREGGDRRPGGGEQGEAG